MATFGVDNFLGELTLDGTTANFKFWDPDDVKNVQEIIVSPKEFPEGVHDASSREVSDYAYSIVAEKMNAARSDRIKQATVEQAAAQQDADKAERAATAQHLNDATDNTVAAAGTEVRADGVKQTVYNTAKPTSEKKK